MKRHLFKSALFASGVLLFGAADAQVIQAPVRTTAPTDAVPTTNAQPPPGVVVPQTTTPEQTTATTTTESTTTLTPISPRNRARVARDTAPTTTASQQARCSDTDDSGAMGCPG